MDPLNLQQGIDDNISLMEFGFLNEGDLKKYCRVCLKADNDLESISCSSSIFKKLQFCNFLDITDEDECFPKQICQNCKISGITSYTLKMQCIKSTSILQEMFKKKQNTIEFVNIKLEPLEDNYSRIESENKIGIKNQHFDNNVGNTSNIDRIDGALIKVEKPNVDANIADIHKNKNNRSCNKQKKLFKCNLCSRVFLSELQLSIHRKFMHLTERKTLKCDKCDKTFRRIALLIEHIKSHRKLNTFQCDTCKKIFKLYENFKKHKCPQPNKCEYNCKECGRAFKTALSVERHMYIHNGESPYICGQCGQIMLSNTALAGHIRRKHSGEKPFSCSVCKKKFSDKGDLIVHNRTHTGEKPFICDVCDAGFTISSHLIVHKRTHSGEKSYKCDVCDKSFTINSSLVIHKRHHTGERPYVCHVCGKGYISGGVLKEHLRKHSNEKPYVCEVCGKKFGYSSSYIQHKRVHLKN